jgi:hypothetical protein
MNKWTAILLIYLGSCCYTIASFYHLSLGDDWTFVKAYLLGIAFVSIEYIFNVIGNKNANKHITIFQIMILIIAFDLINLYIINAVLLKNKIDYLRDGISLILIFVAILISTNFRQNDIKIK